MFTQAFADYQPPQQNRGQSMSMQQTAPPPPPEIPHSVGVAMAFIQQSCIAKGPRGFTKLEDCEQYDEVINVELLAKHEAAFNQACNLMGTFFDSEADRLRRRGALEEAVFIREHGVMLDAVFGGDELGVNGGGEDAEPEKNDMMSCESDSTAGTEGQDVRGYD